MWIFVCRQNRKQSWWRHTMETFSVLLAICAGNSPITRWIPHTKASGAELFMFSLLCAWINGWVNNGEAGDLRRQCARYDVTVMMKERFRFAKLTDQLLFKTRHRQIVTIFVHSWGTTMQGLYNKVISVYVYSTFVWSHRLHTWRPPWWNFANLQIHYHDVIMGPLASQITSLCAKNSPGTGEFPAQMASNAENVSIWWRHHVFQNSVSALRINEVFMGGYTLIIYGNMRTCILIIYGNTRTYIFLIYGDMRIYTFIIYGTIYIYHLSYDMILMIAIVTMWTRVVLPENDAVLQIHTQKY